MAERFAAGFAGYLFDLDGTIYLGPRLLPGAAACIETLRARGARVLFLSNKPLERREAYAQQLTRLGIPTRPEEVITSGLVLARHLAGQAPGARLFVIGEAPLLDELREAGLRATNDPQAAEEAEIVVASLDREFSYARLLAGFRALRRGARFAATNPDRTLPLDGEELPDCAGVIAALEACSGRQCELVAGKPSRLMLEAALAALGLPAEQCLMVGDRLETDIAMGQHPGLRTALVLTGVTRPAMLAASPWQPDYVLPSVADVPSLRPEQGRRPGGTVTAGRGRAACRAGPGGAARRPGSR